MRSLLFAFLVLAVVTVFLLNSTPTILAQTEPAMPPGVNAESWIPLSDRAGILITRSEARQGQPPQGRVVVEIDGQWTDMNLISRGGMTPLTTH
jgi:hypothetical protein